ncbi:hypothetical protein [Actinokineospora bangkokensis]|uniref:Uncharacterized protein n=1 Tax=Actinokineospora bangkokensis TaxID=1193682 RepID=A0A1Q9LPX9_9PSEU|nr:hypothetical protein [Actinokineospora bangkokensis]OLR94043.1 hypothetical protein BJP25_13790 [Actinokineospora bangkokensis]
MGDDITAEALEVDLLAGGVDLLDLYRGGLSYRRLCALVTHLPDDAAVWSAHRPGGRYSTVELLLVALERRITVL